jgi:hypothetical protein
MVIGDRPNAIAKAQKQTHCDFIDIASVKARYPAPFYPRPMGEVAREVL